MDDGSVQPIFDADIADWVTKEHVYEEATNWSNARIRECWRCSRGTVYNLIRGERVLDFAAPGCRGKKLIPVEVVRRIEDRCMKVFR